MKDELKDILDGVDIDGINELDDITPDNVEEILGKYNLDKVKKITEDVDLSDAEKMLNEAYAAVNKDVENLFDDDEELSEEELKKLHEDIKKEVKSTMKHNPNGDNEKTKSTNKLKSKLEVEGDTAETNDKDNKEKDSKDKEDNSTDKKNNKNINDDADVISNDKQNKEDTKKKADKKSTKKTKSTKLDKDDEVVNNTLNTDSTSTQEDKEEVVDEFDDEGNDISTKEKASEMFKKLFYNVQDEEYEKQQRKLDRKEKRKKEAKKKEAIKAKEANAIKAEEKKKKQAEEKAAKAKEKAEQKKKQAEAKKKQLEKKKQKKAALEKEYENEPVGRINKLGAVVVFMFVGLVLFAIILSATQLGKLNDYNEEAYDYFAKGDYDQAYMSMLKLDEKERDAKLYEQLRVLQKLNKKLSYYSSNIALQEREKALDALLTGMELYEKEKQYAKQIGVDEQYSEIYTSIKKYLKEEFKLNEKQAKAVNAIKSQETYSEKVKEICKKTK